jgi:hypothetical protein
MTNPNPNLLWLGCFLVSIVPALILAAILVARRRRRKRSAMDIALWGLLVPLAGYPLGCQAWLVTSAVYETVTAKTAEALMAKLHKGMTPVEVEAAIGRPSEETQYYGSYENPADYSYNWTVRGHRLQVTFIDGRAAEWWSWPLRDYDGFFPRVFLWWLPEMD